MNDTPRTAAAKIACGFQAVPESFLKHAEQLERENAALRASIKSEGESDVTWSREYLYAFYSQAVEQRKTLEKENAALRAAIEDIKREWVCLPETATQLDAAICAALDSARKEQP